MNKTDVSSFTNFDKFDNARIISRNSSDWNDNGSSQRDKHSQKKRSDQVNDIGEVLVFQDRDQKEANVAKMLAKLENEPMPINQRSDASSYYYDEEDEEEEDKKQSMMNIQQNDFLPEFSVNNSIGSGQYNRKPSETGFKITDNLRQVQGTAKISLNAKDNQEQVLQQPSNLNFSPSFPNQSSSEMEQQNMSIRRQSTESMFRSSKDMDQPFKDLAQQDIGIPDNLNNGQINYQFKNGADANQGPNQIEESPKQIKNRKMNLFKDKMPKSKHLEIIEETEQQNNSIGEQHSLDGLRDDKIVRNLNNFARIEDSKDKTNSFSVESQQEKPFEISNMSSQQYGPPLTAQQSGTRSINVKQPDSSMTPSFKQSKNQKKQGFPVHEEFQNIAEKERVLSQDIKGSEVAFKDAKPMESENTSLGENTFQVLQNQLKREQNRGDSQSFLASNFTQNEDSASIDHQSSLINQIKKNPDNTSILSVSFAPKMSEQNAQSQNEQGSDSKSSHSDVSGSDSSGSSSSDESKKSQRNSQHSKNTGNESNTVQIQPEQQPIDPQLQKEYLKIVDEAPSTPLEKASNPMTPADEMIHNGSQQPADDDNEQIINIQPIESMSPVKKSNAQQSQIQTSQSVKFNQGNVQHIGDVVYVNTMQEEYHINKNNSQKIVSSKVKSDYDNNSYRQIQMKQQIESRSHITSDGVDHSVGVAKQSDFKNTQDLLASSPEQSPDVVKHLHQDSEKKQSLTMNKYWFDSSKMDQLKEPIKNDYEPYEETEVVDKMNGNLISQDDMGTVLASEGDDQTLNHVRMSSNFLAISKDSNDRYTDHQKTNSLTDQNMDNSHGMSKIKQDGNHVRVSTDKQGYISLMDSSVNEHYQVLPEQYYDMHVYQQQIAPPRQIHANIMPNIDLQRVEILDQEMGNDSMNENGIVNVQVGMPMNQHPEVDLRKLRRTLLSAFNLQQSPNEKARIRVTRKRQGKNKIIRKKKSPNRSKSPGKNEVDDGQIRSHSANALQNKDVQQDDEFDNSTNEFAQNQQTKSAFDISIDKHKLDVQRQQYNQTIQLNRNSEQTMLTIEPGSTLKKSSLNPDGMSGTSSKAYLPPYNVYGLKERATKIGQRNQSQSVTNHSEQIKIKKVKQKNLGALYKNWKQDLNVRNLRNKNLETQTKLESDIVEFDNKSSGTLTNARQSSKNAKKSLSTIGYLNADVSELNQEMSDKYGNLQMDIINKLEQIHQDKTSKSNKRFDLQKLMMPKKLLHAKSERQFTLDEQTQLKQRINTAFNRNGQVSTLTQPSSFSNFSTSQLDQRAKLANLVKKNNSNFHQMQLDISLNDFEREIYKVGGGEGRNIKTIDHSQNSDIMNIPSKLIMPFRNISTSSRSRLQPHTFLSEQTKYESICNQLNLPTNSEGPSSLNNMNKLQLLKTQTILQQGSNTLHRQSSFNQTIQQQQLRTTVSTNQVVQKSKQLDGQKTDWYGVLQETQRLNRNNFMMTTSPGKKLPSIMKLQDQQ